MFLASFMSSIFEYIQNNPQEAQRLVGLKYEQVQELLNKAAELKNCNDLIKELVALLEYEEAMTVDPRSQQKMSYYPCLPCYKFLGFQTPMALSP